MNNSQKDLQRLFNSLSLANYGKSKKIKLPFFGGYLEMHMEFNNGMIDLISATSNVMGISSRCDYFSIGYTCPVGLARSARVALDHLNLEGFSAIAKLTKTSDEEVSLKIAAQVQQV